MPLRDKSGGLRGYAKIMRDLTASKHAQEATRQQLDELRRFNDAAVGREIRMGELKQEVNELYSKKHGEQPRYDLKPEQPESESQARNHERAGTHRYAR